MYYLVIKGPATFWLKSADDLITLIPLGVGKFIGISSHVFKLNKIHFWIATFQDGKHFNGVFIPPLNSEFVTFIANYWNNNNIISNLNFVRLISNFVVMYRGEMVFCDLDRNAFILKNFHWCLFCYIFLIIKKLSWSHASLLQLN